MSSSHNTDKMDLEAASPKHKPSGLWAYLNGIIDSKHANYISLYACFLTGYTSALSFSACYIWCGFQTGNLAQLGIAVARNFDPRPERTFHFEKPDQQAFTSLLAFLVGTMLGRIGDRMGAKKRTWLALAAFMQCLLLMAAALCAHYCGQGPYAINRITPSWSNAVGMCCLAFLSASLGLQGIVGKRVGSPMNTTIVLTTTWVEIFNDPMLLALRPVKSRDVRIGGVFFLFLGAFFSRAFTNWCKGAPGAIGVLCGLRLIQMVWWLFIPSPPAEEK